MRPDIIHWQDKQDQIALTLLPRRRMRRVLMNWFALMIVIQVVSAAAVLLALQTPWRLQIDLLAVYDLKTRVLLDGVIAIAAGFLVAIAIVLPLANRRFRRWTSGFSRLHGAIRRLTQSADPKPVPVGGEDEIAYLLVAFNEMSGKLVASRNALIEANADLEKRVAERTDELRVANAELEIKNVKLAELTDTALKFTDDVAHEFRTPLTVVMEFASIIADGLGGQVTDKQSEYLQFIIDASKDLANLVDDFLDSGKLRAHRLRVDRRSHSVDEILDSSWPMLETRAASRKITLEKHVDAGVPSVFADIEKIRRALINLVMNAVKFSKVQSKITISARRLDDGGVEIGVTDQGPGLNAEELASLFQRFTQTAEGQRASAKGFGLGLNIVRDLVTLNLGKVSVKSTVGKGSTFSFTLPACEPQLIQEWYLARVAERAPSAALTVLRITRQSSSYELDEVRTFLASALYPNDIQLPCVDERSVIVIGETIEADRWRNRLLRDDAIHRKFLHDKGLAPLAVEHVGTWRVSQASDRIAAAMRSRPMEVQRCA